MLKIKDNVDLKELEKYGYKKSGNHYYLNVYRDRDGFYHWEERILINTEDRIIRSEITHDLTDKYWICDEVNITHYIYDLEDLVEKVEE